MSIIQEKGIILSMVFDHHHFERLGSIVESIDQRTKILLPQPVAPKVMGKEMYHSLSIISLHLWHLDAVC